MTCAVVGTGIALTGGALPTGELMTSDAAARISSSTDRVVSASRDTTRVAVAPAVVAKRWTTTDLDLRLTPSEDARTRGEFQSLKKIGITGVRKNGYVQVVVDKRAYWVTADYLARKKPTDPASLPVLGKPCPDGSVENGLTSGAVRVYRAVCNNFPQVSSYGGYDNHGEHSSGKALDIMTGDVSLGNAIADFLRAHAAELDLYDVIWRQRIFTQERGGEGWRHMPSRGSATANHFDHVHVSVN